MSKRPPPPTSAAPISQDVVAIVKKKLAAPKGPPPMGLATFKPKAATVPSSVTVPPPTSSSGRDEEGDSYYDDRDDRDDDQYESDESYSRDSRDQRREDERMRELDRAERGDNSSSSAAYADSPTAAYSSASSNAQPSTIFGGMLAASKAAADAPSKTGKPIVPFPGQNITFSTGSLLPQRLDKSAKHVIFNFTPILKVTYRELRNFVLSPIQPGVIVRCYIERDRSGTNMFSPMYSLCADLEDGTGRELLACRKVLQSRSAHYVFSLKSEDLWRKREQRSRLYLGKLRATSSNEYVLYDNGTVGFPDGMKEREELPSDDGKSGEDTLYRKELAVIWINTMSRPAPTGVRGTEVSIPGSFMTNEQIAIATNNTQVNISVAATKIVGDFQATANTAAGNIGILHSSRDLRGPFGRIRSAGMQNLWQPKTCFVLHERTSRYVILMKFL